MPGPRLARLLALLALAAAPAVVGCGEDGGGSGASGGGTRTQEAEAAPDLKDTGAKPAIEKPTGSPPRKLVKEDIVRGKGRAAKPGDVLTVHYVGVSFSSGEEFDASWDRGQPFPFELGAGEVIAGWDKGLVGMRQGGRRRLVIPPSMAYGTHGSPPQIGPNETLVFVVDLVKAD